jgi:hypothetical protein
MGLDLVDASELAGYYMAHAILSISDGETLVPMIGWERGDSRQLVRMTEERLEEGAAAGRAWLEKNPERVDRAVLVVDGYYPLEGRKTDALLAEIVEYGDVRRSFRVVLPYRSARAEGGFAVHRPKVLIADGREVPGLVEAFFSGVDAHEKGSQVWSEHIVESP